VTDRVRRDVVDGVTVYWTPDAARRIGSIQFRIGRADERFTTTGVTHLVEHLSMFPLGRQPYGHNGFVEHVRTVFHANGSDAEVVGFLGAITDHLSALPVDRLEPEGRVLRTEASTRPPNIPGLLLWYRYGARGYGLLGVPENGLHRLGADDVTSWSAAGFTRGNAVAWYSGPLPDGLRFSLPDGPRLPPPDRVDIPDLPAKAWIPGQFPGVALGILVHRDSPSAMGLRIVTHRLEQKLRYDLGRSYEVSLAYLPLDANVAQGSIFASCLPAEAATVRDDFLSVVAGFVSTGPKPAELTDDIADFERHLADQDSIYSELERAAFNELLGHPPDSGEQILEEMRAVSPSQVHHAIEAALATAYLVDPVGTAPEDGGWEVYPTWSATAVSGRAIDTATRRFPWQPRVEQLILGPDGVTWTHAQGMKLTVRYADCVGVISDGTLRILYGVDGFSVRVDSEYWKGGQDVVRAIDAAIPPELVIPIKPEGS
jgi:zinc protease